MNIYHSNKSLVLHNTTTEQVGNMSIDQNILYLNPTDITNSRIRVIFSYVPLYINSWHLFHTVWTFFQFRIMFSFFVFLKSMMKFSERGKRKAGLM